MRGYGIAKHLRFHTTRSNILVSTADSVMRHASSFCRVIFARRVQTSAKHRHDTRRYYSAVLPPAGRCFLITSTILPPFFVDPHSHSLSTRIHFNIMTTVNESSVAVCSNCERGLAHDSDVVRENGSMFCSQDCYWVRSQSHRHP